jgi:hypothetical protein
MGNFMAALAWRSGLSVLIPGLWASGINLSNNDKPIVLSIRANVKIIEFIITI